MHQSEMFVPISCQIAMFFSPTYQFKNLAIASKISENFANVFSQEPSVNNFPSNMPIPQEIPRITLQEDQVGQLVVSAIRADLSININETQTIKNIPDNVVKFANCFDVKQIVRIGLICNYKTIKDIAAIKQRYILDDKLSGINGLLLGWTKKVVIKDQAFNQFVNLNIIDPTINESIITIDHNSMQGDICKFNQPEDIKELAISIMEQIGDDISVLLEWNRK